MGHQWGCVRLAGWRRRWQTCMQDYPPAAVVMAALSSTEPTTQQFTFFAPGNLAMRSALPGYTGPVKSVEVRPKGPPSHGCHTFRGTLTMPPVLGVAGAPV